MLIVEFKDSADYENILSLSGNQLTEKLRTTAVKELIRWLEKLDLPSQENAKFYISYNHGIYAQDENPVIFWDIKTYLLEIFEIKNEPIEFYSREIAKIEGKDISFDISGPDLIEKFKSILEESLQAFRGLQKGAKLRAKLLINTADEALALFQKT